MKIFSALFLSVLLAVETSGADLQQIYKSSVLVRTEDEGSGSGSVFKSSAGEYLILTAAHVGWDTPWAPLIVSQAIEHNGQKIGELATLADVILASHPYYGYDIAVLRPRDRIFTNAVVFFTGDIPSVGTPIFQCGSPGGAWLERSMTFGHVSKLDCYRTRKQQYPLDLSTCAVRPGASGGGMFLTSTGDLVGFLDEWEGPTFGLFVPVRSILEFLHTENILDK